MQHRCRGGGQGGRWGVGLLVMVVAEVLLQGSAAPAQVLPPYYEDATLYGVYFVDAQEGWAVGDAGVIWHTVDGGEHWERQKSGTRASLRGVHFLTPYTGWVVGRREELGLGPIGVVLRTRDGGWQWEEVSWGQLPPLQGVRFFDERRGVVWGDGRSASPEGVYMTEDGGRSWRPVEGVRLPGCRAMVFRPDHSCAVAAGLEGRCALWDHSRDRWQMVEGEGSRHWYAAADDGQMPGPATYYLVGDGGAIRQSRDGGVSWQNLVPELPAAALAMCDFRACAAWGRHLWIAGRAGRLVLYSPDRGQTWHRQRLEVPLTIHGMFFLTDRQGWLVGELGVIHATRDGGANWKVQRVGAGRAAALAVQARPQQLPVEQATLWGGAAGYRWAALVITRNDGRTAGWEALAEEERWRQAWRDSGGVALNREWAFPLPLHAQDLAPRQLLTLWDRWQGRSAADHLLRRLVFALRHWRPEIVTGDLLSAEAPGEDRLVLTALQEAFKRAADPSSFAEQIEVLGLEPWGARRLYAQAPLGCSSPAEDRPAGNRNSPAELQAARVCSRLDATAWHPVLDEAPAVVAAEPARLLGRFPWTQMGWVLIARRDKTGTATESKASPPAATATSPAVNSPEVWEGVELTAGGPARRPLIAPGHPPTAITERRQQAEAVQGRWDQLDRPLNRSESLDAWLAACAQTLGQLPEVEAPRRAVLLAERCQAAGRWHQAQALLSWTAEQWPGHPAALAAQRWLLRYETGVETRQRLWPTTSALLTERPADAAILPTAGRKASEGSLPVWDKHSPAFRLLRHAHSEGHWQVWGPLHADDPAVQLSRITALRHIGRRDQAVQLLRHWLPRSPEQIRSWLASDSQRAALAAELWLVDPQRFAHPPLPVIAARATDSRPFLDGRLDDACWKQCHLISLQPVHGDHSSPGQSWLTHACFCWDEQYLYVGVRCAHAADQRVSPLQPRPRDADLRGRDRLELLLDLDRDGQTFFRFCVDHRGAPAEDCTDDPQWNPKYFLAYQADDQAWIAEWAIPWKELGLPRAPASQTIAFQLLRIIPAHGVLGLAPAHGGDIRHTPVALLRFQPD
ncbi:MAG: YCF48-related protein [Gemmataceae bacterium]|nr:YCF48-related protein [Gemmataceae bacterium]MDW8243903.1 YCF48-related protein [Thermogemmata sp.]